MNNLNSKINKLYALSEILKFEQLDAEFLNIVDENLTNSERLMQFSFIYRSIEYILLYIIPFNNS